MAGFRIDDHHLVNELGEGCRKTPTFVVRAEGGVEDVTVEPLFSYEVRIESPHRRPEGIGHEVYRVMAEIEIGRDLDPFAPFPL